jgi:hypothetical protein
MKFSIQEKTKQNKLGKKNTIHLSTFKFQSFKIFTICVCEPNKNITLLPKAYKKVYTYKEQEIGDHYKKCKSKE